MRAVFHSFDNVSDDEAIIVTGDAAHHLNVVRLRANEDLLLLNGKGSILTTKVLSVAKNTIEIKVVKSETFTPKHQLSLAVAMPKKDAFEDILKMAVELGINEIYPLVSEYSQYEYAPSERVQRILESALIQSNNPFFPVIHEQRELGAFLKEHQETIVFFNSRPAGAKKEQMQGPKKTILIGPEGGFSPEEVTAIGAYNSVLEIHLATPILRAPTAVASSVGYLLAAQSGPK
ncbi:16S rRNA (uracil(1498)-N(3))-methyltransferase [Bacteriovorax stolpii]|uniref:Ribosomal RNA small subunit methyltransferase E n=1 Tax=Bacteriovorax stolpii TaxID=960 RepID=A0A2K9NM60_BACTC|nr:RsmE family RNA methyltransferase [Bacteriovorax stolpii]AUN96596.1 hypothetical protein C0V70_00440 [Bacteriovorax stolpii]QDK43472.1 16S rRNA (uracil(1498)-N(3))-methyltransferase [Bacteriovorax stolpii]TDP53883.1 16S rRNA (uracil1498-N3)-methyltransferase [Bacteriovorax stolpii]